MRLRPLCYSLVVVIAGLFPCLGQHPTGSATQESLLPKESPSGDISDVRLGRFTGRPQDTLRRPKDGVRHPDIDTAWAEYEAAIAEASSKIIKILAMRFEAATTKGDFDAAVKWQGALKEFTNAGLLPTESEIKAAVSTAQSDLKKAKDELSESYEKLVKHLTMEKNIEGASLVRIEQKLLSHTQEAQTRAPSNGNPKRAIQAKSKHRIEAGKSWQPTIEALAGQEYVISAHGRWTANVNKNNWQGPEFVGENGLRARIGNGKVIRVGKGITLKPTESGMLFLELFGNHKENDRGFVDVQID